MILVELEKVLSGCFYFLRPSSNKILFIEYEGYDFFKGNVSNKSL